MASMNRRTWLATCAAVVSVWPARRLLAADGVDVPLFDGTTLTGWTGDTSLWSVVDGVIVGKSDGIKHNQFLTTDKTFGDFELTLEMKLDPDTANSGIQFRSKRVPDSTEVSGYQADAGQGWWGSLYDESRRNKTLVTPPKDLIDRVVKKGDWNQYTIRAVGADIELKINSETTIKYTEADASMARTGCLALQIHSGPALTVMFRNLKLKSFDRSQ